MGVIAGTALSLMLAVGGAVVADQGGPGAVQHYLAGHILLGMGIGLLATIIVRTGVRLLRASSRSAPRTAETLTAPADPASVTVLPVRHASAVPLRGRRAA